MVTTTLARRAAGSAGRVLYTYPMSRKYIMAARTVQAAWRYRRAIKRGAKWTYRAYASRKRTKYSKRSMPSTRQFSQAKGDPYPVATGGGSFFMGSLQIQSLPWPQWSGADGLTQRTRNTILFKGVKICRYFEYLHVAGSANDIGPIEVHWALVQFKDPKLLTTDLSILNDTFRSYESDTTKSQNFPTYNSTSNWDMMLNCAPLNPEKWRILTHQKFVLEAKSTGNDGRQKVTPTRGQHYRKLEGYKKFNKYMMFRDTSNGAPDNDIVELYWYNTISPVGFPTNPVANSYIGTRKAHIMYFSDSKKK